MNEQDTPSADRPPAMAIRTTGAVVGLGALGEGPVPDAPPFVALSLRDGSGIWITFQLEPRRAFEIAIGMAQCALVLDPSIKGNIATFLEENE